MKRGQTTFSRAIVAGLCALGFGCASPPPREPTIIEVLPTGYRVDGRTLATTAELRGHIIAQRVQEVRVVPLMDTSYARVHETMGALGDLGLDFGIIGHERKSR